MPDHQFPRRHRLELAAYDDPETAFHLAIRAHSDTRPLVDRALGDAVWSALVRERALGRAELLAACLMPDHLHVIARPRSMNLVRWVGAYKSWTTRLGREHRRTGVLWQPSFYDTRLRDERALLSAFTYLRENPVAANLVSTPDDWPWLFISDYP